MIALLSNLDSSIADRYSTVEVNIKSQSNSYYDSFLDLLETTLKWMLAHHEIEYDASKTCGTILKSPNVKEFCSTFIVKETYEKLLDYTKKANDHKHKKEKHVTKEAVLNQMYIYYSFIFGYYKTFLNISIGEFPVAYFDELFGSWEKEKQELKMMNRRQEEEMLRRADFEKTLEKRMQTIETKFASKINRPTLQMQNTANEQELLQRFLKTSCKEYHWIGSEKEWTTIKKVLWIAHLVLLGCGILSTIVVSAAVKIYSTFTFLENLWLIASLVLLYNVLTSKGIMPDYVLAKKSPTVYFPNSIGLFSDTYKKKKPYVVFRVLAYIGVICNLIYIWTSCKNSALATISTIFEVLFLGLTLFIRFFSCKLYDGYIFIYFKGFNEFTHQRVILVYDPLHKKYYDVEEFESRTKGMVII